MGTETVRHAILFGSVPCEDWSFLNSYMQPSAYIICADGGLTNAYAAGLSPNCVIGDWDSGGKPLVDILSISLPAEKDMTDLQAAAEHAIQLGIQKMVLCGCTGGRLDHTASNLVLLEWIYDHGGQGIIVDSQNEIQFLDSSSIKLSAPIPYRYLSLIPLDRIISGVGLYGVKYPLENATLYRGDTLSISNEPAAAQLEVRVGSGRALLICSERIPS